MLVRVPPEDAFRIFTEEIDGWWRAGRRYRIGRDRSVVHLEPKLGGRLFERFRSASGAETVVETGRVTSWEPPARLVLEWRAVNFAPGETTEVEVRFERSPSGTNVTLVHRGWARIRPDHPVRHGEDVSVFTRSLASWWGGLLTAFRMRAVDGA